MRILVVEDHLLFQESLVRLLNARPDTTVIGAVNSLQEALVQVHQFKPDVILMDCSLSDGTVLDASRTILAELPDTKIVLLTMDEVHDKVHDAIRQGAYGYLPKSVTSSHLLGYLNGIECEGAAI